MIEYFVMIDRVSQLERFNGSVTNALNIGWKLQGNLVIALDAGGTEWIYQAMTRIRHESEQDKLEKEGR